MGTGGWPSHTLLCFCRSSWCALPSLGDAPLLQTKGPGVAVLQSQCLCLWSEKKGAAANTDGFCFRKTVHACLLRKGFPSGTTQRKKVCPADAEDTETYVFWDSRPWGRSRRPQPVSAVSCERVQVHRERSMERVPYCPLSWVPAACP